VESVGEAVTGVVPGDHVVLTFLYCGTCANCLAGLRPYCDSMFSLNFGGRRSDGSSPLTWNGTPVSGEFMGQSSFATHALVDERALVRVPSDLPLEILGPLGCSVQTGAGAVLNALRPEAGTSIAIFGAGAVGLTAVMAAGVAGCLPIVAVDVKPERLAAALEYGATHAIDAREGDVVAEIRRITHGGAAQSLEMSGVPSVLAQAVECLRETGVCGLVGAAPVGAEANLDWLALLRGRTVRGVIYGDSLPEVFVPRLLELHRAGRLPFDRLIREFPFAAINEAAAASERGDVIKPVLRLP
jgi:aryl-alcohol dehydrogenase